MPAATIARVLVDAALPQLDRLLDYRVPPGMADVAPGVRVTVPLRSASRMTQGFVVDLGEQQDYPGPLSDVEAVVSPIPVLRPEVWRLARAVADRAAGSAIDVLRLAIPPRQVRDVHLDAGAAQPPDDPVARVGHPALTRRIVLCHPEDMRHQLSTNPPSPSSGPKSPSPYE